MNASPKETAIATCLFFVIIAVVEFLATPTHSARQAGKQMERRDKNSLAVSAKEVPCAPLTIFTVQGGDQPGGGVELGFVGDATRKGCARLAKHENGEVTYYDGNQDLWFPVAGGQTWEGFSTLSPHWQWSAHEPLVNSPAHTVVSR